MKALPSVYDWDLNKRVMKCSNRVTNRISSWSQYEHKKSLEIRKPTVE